MDKEITEKTIEQLKDLAEEVITPSGDIPYYRVTFPAANNAEYYFVVYIYDTETEITARRIGADEGEAFWHIHLEDFDYESIEAMHEALIEKIFLVLRHPTRVRQSNGVLFVNYTCDYSRENEWHKLYGNSFFKFGGFKPPKIIGKEKIYTSGPLLNT